MKKILQSPLGILGCLALCGFAAVQALTPVSYLKGGVANRVLTDNGTSATWSSSVAASAVPSLDASKIGSGQLALSRGGTGADLSATGGTGQVLRQSTVGAAVSVSALSASEVGAVPTSRTLSLVGTTNQVSVSGGTQDLSGNRTWNLSGPQDLATGSAPTFLGASLTGLSTSMPVVTDGAKALASLSYNAFASSITSGLAASALTSGTLGVARGGTGLASFTAGDLLAASGTGTLAPIGIGSSNQVLTVSGGAPVWSTWATGLPAASTLGRVVYDSGSSWSATSALSANRVMVTSSGQVPSTNGNLTFDGNTLTATQGAAGSAGTVLKAASSATADQLQVQDASGNPLVSWNGRSFQFQGHNAVGNIFVGRDDLPSPTTVIGAYNFHTLSSSSRVVTAAWGTVAAESFDSTHFGTDLFAQAVVPGSGSTTQVRRLYIRGNGDIELNGAETSISTSATSGFTYFPSCSGKPSGTPTSRSGNSPGIYDSTNGCFWMWDGSKWSGTGDGHGIDRQTSGTPSVTCGTSDTYIWDYASVHTAGEGNWTLPAAALGRRLTFINFSNADTFRISRSGSDLITNGTSSGNTSITMTGAGSTRSLQSDGVSKWFVVGSVGS